MKMGREELANCLIYQVGALCGFLQAEGLALNHIKPHGALYGMAGRDEEIAHAVCDAADVFRVPLYGMIGTLHESVYAARGHAFVSEYYADLDYDDAGRIVIVRSRGLVDAAQAAERVRRAVRDGRVRSVGGVDVAVRADSICVHSDTPNAVEVARAVREAV